MHTRHRSRRHPVRRWAGNALLIAVIGLVAAGIAAVLTGRYQVRPVLSGSMRPGLPVGGVVVTERVPISSLHERDVIVFHRPDKPQDLVVHRIISMKKDASGSVIQTQGDANNAPDPWTVTLAGTTAYRAVFSLPLLGYAAVWIHSPIGREIFLIVGALLVLGAAASGLLARSRKSHRAEQANGLPADVSHHATNPDTASVLTVR